ncbi:ribonuclease 3-like protein 3 [Henckelia pumila]|uniref:ribonuclease 3-like protein 3 n=1 Tax=Henckelia pumila TaxID=405737 RepID=UPI003C6DCD25
MFAQKSNTHTRKKPPHLSIFLVPLNDEGVEIFDDSEPLDFGNRKSSGDDGDGEVHVRDLVMEIREILGGYEFKDKTLLVQAFTHHSYEEDCSSYERLEFIGDSVLNFLVTRELYFTHLDLNPGQLTKLRAANVDNEKLARVAMKYSLHKFLLHNKPLLANKIEEFSEDMKKYPLHSFGLIDAPKVLADIVESLIGAIYIDSNSSMDKTWEIMKTLLVPLVTPASVKMHPATRLHELCQKMGFKVEIRDYWKKTGEFEFFVDDEFVGRGKYLDKKSIACNRAAHDAYCNLMQKLDMEGSHSSRLKLF